MPVASELFRIVTVADPERVWDTLTPTKGCLAYLYGMTVESEWTAGSSLSLAVSGGPRLQGTVVFAERPRRLSYTVGEEAERPLVYVTWETRVDPAGTVVRLYVDELDAGRESAHELESAWLPVLSALKSQLESGVTALPTEIPQG